MSVMRRAAEALGIIDVDARVTHTKAEAVAAERDLQAAEKALSDAVGRRAFGVEAVDEALIAGLHADIAGKRAALAEKQAAASYAADPTRRAEVDAAKRANAEAWEEARKIADERDACLDRIILRQRQNEDDSSEYCRLSSALLAVTPRPPNPPDMLSPLKSADRLLEIVRWLSPTVHREELRRRAMGPKGGVEALIKTEQHLSAWSGRRDFTKET